MTKVLVKIGDKYNRLTIIKEVEKRGNNRYFKCKCDCGNIKSIRLNHLRAGSIKSCGCLLKETGNIKHGLSNTRWYNIWQGMKERCYNQKHDSYHNYGGRGITICDRWIKSVEYFYEDMKKGYSNKLTIDRINNDGDYCKSNCKWSTQKEQSNNTRVSINPIIRKEIKKINCYIKNKCLNPKLIEFRGELKTISEWCIFLNIDYTNVSSRIYIGWTPLEALRLIKRKNC